MRLLDEIGPLLEAGDLLDVSAVALPAGLTDNGRPVGLSLIGPAFAGTHLLWIAHHLQEVS